MIPGMMVPAGSIMGATGAGVAVGTTTTGVIGGAGMSAGMSLSAAMPYVAAAVLIGSWIYSTFFAKQKNIVIDPGAQEMPRFNQALRGTTVPVLFGTNKVPSQIVWMDNFKTVRNEEDQGGGKMGGSGKAGPTTTTVTYEYYWDILFHFGFTPEPYSLLRAWVGADEVDPDSIATISQSSTQAASINSLLGVLSSITESSDYVNIQADEVIYFPGNRPESNDWDHFTSEVGFPVRWPGTAWLGTKQLFLGEQPHIPQLTVEIGPIGGSITPDQGAPEGYHQPSLGTLQFTNSLSLVPAKGGYYVGNGDNGGGTVWGISLTDGSAAWDITAAELRNDIRAAGHTDISSTALPSYGPYGASIGDGSYMFVWAVFTISGTNYIYGTLYNTTGATPTYVHTFRCEGFNFDIDYPLFIDICGHKTTSDKILFAYIGRVSLSDFQTLGFFFPSISEYVSGVGLGRDASENANTFTHTFGFNCLRIGEADGEYLDDSFDNTFIDGEPNNSARHYSTYSHRQAPTGFCLPALNGGDHTRIYWYFPKTVTRWYAANAGTNTAHDALVASAGSNGYMVHVKIDPPTRLYTVAADYGSAFVDTPPVVDTGTSTVQTTALFPFDDDGLNVSGSENLNYAYWGSNVAVIPFELIEGVSSFIVTFTQEYQDSANAAPYGLYAKVRAYLYLCHPLEGPIWMNIGDQEGALVDTVAKLGRSEGNRYTVQNKFVRVFPYPIPEVGSGQSVNLITVGGIGTDDEAWIAKWGTMRMPPGGDLTPPEIIYKILTDTFFGMAVPSSQIDTVSYNAAVAYCQTEGFYVSTQYRREQSILQIFEALLAIYGGYLTWNGAKLKFGWFAQTTAVRTIDNSHLVVKPDTPPVKTTPGARQDTANLVKVNYVDRSLDYYQNQVAEGDEVDQDLNGIRIKEFPPDFVMSEATARKIASRTLWANLYGRNMHEFTLSYKDSDLEPGDVVTLVDSFGNINEDVRIVYWIERERGRYEVGAITEVGYAYSSDPGVNSSTIISSAGSNIFGRPEVPQATAAYELPAEYSTEPVVYINWASGGHLNAGAQLWVSPDGTTYSMAQDRQPYPISGRLLTGLTADPAQAFAQDVEVLLFPHSSWTSNSPTFVQCETLPSVTIDAYHYGQMLLWCGSEMMSGYNPTLVSQNRYRFSRLYRGWGGTHLSDHSSGDWWFQHGSGIFRREFTEGQIGTQLYYKVVPYNLQGNIVDVSSVVGQAYTVKGAYYRPAHAGRIATWINSEDNRGLRKIKVTSEQDVPMVWQDTARLAGYGLGGMGTGVGGYGRFTADTASRAWRLEVVGSGGVVVRSTVVSSPSYVYTSSQNFADNGAWRGTLGFKLTPFNHNGDAPRTSVRTVEMFI